MLKACQLSYAKQTDNLIKFPANASIGLIVGDLAFAGESLLAQCVSSHPNQLLSIGIDLPAIGSEKIDFSRITLERFG
jgi:hypothetical protein